MTKMMTTKTLFSLALMASAFSLAACSPEYHDERDPHMSLSTPPMVDAKTSKTVNVPVLEQNGWRSQTTVVTPSGQPPLLIDSSETKTTVTTTDVQMLGQPGAGPSILSPTAEAMPGTAVVTDQSYPHPSR